MLKNINLYIIKNPTKFKAISINILLLSTLIFSLLIRSQSKINLEKDIEGIIHALTPLEKEHLTNFFRLTFFGASWGYTLIGDKPMSFDRVDVAAESKNVDGFDYMDIFHILDRYRAKEGWLVWLKVAPKLKLKNFSLIYFSTETNPYLIEIALINHQSFMAIVDQHLADFQSVLGNELTAKKILKEYVKGKGELFNKIRNHDGLFGTLLGYGRDNAWRFMSDGSARKMAAFFDFDIRENFKGVLSPSFGVIEGTNETKELRRSYLQQKKVVDEVYKSEQFLKEVLIRLTQ